MKKLLVVVDYQNDFVSGSLGFPKAAQLEEAIIKKIEDYRAAGDDVVFTLDTHGPDYLSTQEGKNLPVEHCIKGTDGWQLYGKVAALAEGCQKFEKETFGSDSLYKYLKENPYESIELCGLVSNICVVSNAVLAKTAQPQTPVLVDARCTAALDEETNEKTLDVMAGFQVRIVGR
ncbi:cysteine hydrolase family protein [Provencibacterium massiliense]|uniref:cysteine hydrolase family protein n=1 Tax=Provencibacterium massiliense TaxID=1841868 RepID=UPI0009A6A8BC|nr:isochorismatase family cysteine hydrolase [Provencibacterium massiliense]RGB67970.1 cysteine hydrolase [Harryflintia acetispora]